MKGTEVLTHLHFPTPGDSQLVAGQHNRQKIDYG